MKRMVLFLIIILFAGSCLAAGEQPDPFEAKHRDKDQIILEYNLTIKVNEDWSFTQEDYRKLKILKEQAIGDLVFSYDKSRDKILEISAYTITPDGKKYPYTLIQDQSEYKSFPGYSDAMKKVVVMPRVNVGSIIEYKVVTKSKGQDIKDSYCQALYLDMPTPVKLFRTTFIFPNKLNVRYQEFNLTHKPKITRDSKTVTYAWEIRDVYRDSKSEIYSPPPTAASMSEEAAFSSIKSWDDYSRFCYGLFKKNLNVTPEIAAAASQAILGKVTLKDKVRAILEYIQDNFRYLSVSLGEHNFEPHPTDEVFKNRYGDCKDLSLLCLAMLKSAGIGAKCVLFQECYSAIDPQLVLPGTASFNHVLLFVETGNGEGFYIDPQLKYYDIGEYPMSYQQAYTLIIGEDGYRFSRFPVFSEERQHEKQDLDAIIYPDGSILSEKNTLHDLDDSIELRKNAASLGNEHKRELSRTKESFDPGIELIATSLKFSPRYGRVTEYVKWRKPNALAVSDGLIVLEIPGWQNLGQFSKENRENPIFWAINSRNEYNLTYHLPKGYQILSLPENFEKTIGFFYFKREYQLDNDKIIMRQTSRTKQMLTSREDYRQTKELFANLTRDTFQRIILKKK